MLEIYNNPPDQVPSYAEMNPLQVHLAFVSESSGVDKEMLVSVGATLVD